MAMLEYDLCGLPGAPNSQIFETHESKHPANGMEYEGHRTITSIADIAFRVYTPECSGRLIRSNGGKEA